MFYCSCAVTPTYNSSYTWVFSKSESDLQNVKFILFCHILFDEFPQALQRTVRETNFDTQIATSSFIATVFIVIFSSEFDIHVRIIIFRL